MATIKPLVNNGHNASNDRNHEYYASGEGKNALKKWVQAGGAASKMRCICNYELIRDDDNTLRCTGGSHRYRFEDGTLMYDKFGNAYIKPSSEDEDAKPKAKK